MTTINNNNNFLVVVLIVLISVLIGDEGVNAMYKDDVGVLDFSIATAGHGPIGVVHTNNKNGIVITTDKPTTTTTTSCFVAGRQINDGSLVWRRNVCSVPDEDAQAHAIAVGNDDDDDADAFYTVDNVGIVRAWTIENGDLLWDTRIHAAAAAPKLWVTKVGGTTTYVAVASAEDELVFLNAETGTIVDKVSASKSTGNGQRVEWLSVLSSSTSTSMIKIIFSKVQVVDGTIQTDMFGADGDSVVVSSLLECSSSSGKMTVLLGTERGSTTLFSLETTGDDGVVNVKVHWTAEEGLASLSSAIVLDASHLGSDDLVEEKDAVSRKLSLAGRLNSQWEDVVGMLSTANGLINNNAVNFSYRDHLFGFVKVAALLSPKVHRIWGMSTAGKDRGSIRWSLDLPKKAIWHSMVHGTTNSAKATHGIHGDTHSREILVLSVSSASVDWMCIDGTSGAINSQDSIKISSPVVQVLPVYGTNTGGCRQASILLGEDLSLTVVPADTETNALIKKQLYKTPNGLYTHKIDKVANKVESYRVAHTEEDDKFVARSIGLTSFAGEQIVKVAYPLRHEDVKSMSTILGDNSLLLKYINPHMTVVVTVLSDSEHQTATTVATALEKERNGKAKKPVGAGAPGSSIPPSSQNGSEDLPNMFINLVDTVSGRVLYRHSHSNVDGDKKVSVVISENWVIYTYVNEKTRRTEIGVLTLHEGMIEPKGLTFFARPEQSTSFSSFDARESKPVVLSKVYAFPKAVTALGVTSTRQGISRQNILIASSDGALNTINKMILETRRPVGEAKPEEKKEGLMPYRELIPESPLFSLTYNQTNEPFTSIISTATSLESQSLVFGFGGPDLFFTRTSPTKGFDVLPETFNKILVGSTTAGIVIALLVVQRMGKKKTLKQGWL
ncbi:DUF1620-domain-containing protein [Fragilariopsis cylindrus CCMP1102]|uniref:ER membrane protein complex subunit 1 n=1 Tax=Fragilariopsis cylindrus CCMP1102 TaxID=635003 RepID=A0A1E7FUN6_9STRA|nr:DUF1620-domain-containing protein [Fragilariopsis cylindrus CCMP1102]|eukprot:OEU21827.1 DUF1620-domain-containing protein [Fragilariopsis cylindrus CCMP1102]